MKKVGRGTARQGSGATTEPSVLTIKSRAFAMPILHVHVAEPAAVAATLEELIKAHPDFFSQRIPVVVDLSECAEADRVLLPPLIDALRQAGLLPCAVMGSEAIRAQAILAGLGIFGQHPPKQRANTQDFSISPMPQEKKETPKPNSSTKVIKGQVRSGQQVHASAGDIVVLGSVNAGAEVMADGSIHVYGTLRGRVLAGARGDRQARIFCQAMEAELVAIAGFYRTADELDASCHGKPAYIFLDGETVVVETVAA